MTASEWSGYILFVSTAWFTWNSIGTEIDRIKTIIKNKQADGRYQ